MQSEDIDEWSNEESICYGAWSNFKPNKMPEETSEYGFIIQLPSYRRPQIIFDINGAWFRIRTGNKFHNWIKLGYKN